jgi:hypothetical protein
MKYFDRKADNLNLCNHLHFLEYSPTPVTDYKISTVAVNAGTAYELTGIVNGPTGRVTYCRESNGTY